MPELEATKDLVSSLVPILVGHLYHRHSLWNNESMFIGRNLDFFVDMHVHVYLSYMIKFTNKKKLTDVGKQKMINVNQKVVYNSW